MERLYEIHASGTYDLVIVDTPPTRNAVDFLDAPERMAEFFTSRFLRLLIAPYRSRLVSMASKPFYQVADRILGTQFLQDIAEFFILFQSMYDGFVQRARAVSALLRDKRSTFVVVSTLEAAPLDEAEFFLDQLAARKLHLGAIVLNKVLPNYFLDAESYRVAERIPGDAKRIAAAVATPDEDEADVARVLDEVADSYLRYSVVAQREAEQRAELAASPDVIAAVPYFETDITDLRGLLQLGEKIW
jgi:anion-transporting  ArsA/GET3 family ATPase